MEKLEAIEVAEIGIITVNGVIGKNIFEAAKECIYISNLLQIAVNLYWNGEHIMIYKNDTFISVLGKIKSKKP